MLDFNRSKLSATPLSVAINELIACAELPGPNLRHYLGASAIGSECLRKVQFDWMVAPVHASRTRDIFRRGHLFEGLTRQHLVRAGLVFAPEKQLGFSAARPTGVARPITTSDSAASTSRRGTKLPANARRQADD